MKHPLAAWIEDRPDVSQAKLAAEAKCSEPHLSLILQRKRGVSMNLAKRLSDLTSGAVSVEAFLLDQETEALQ